MAEFTENYGLEKPAQSDFYNVAVQNQNMDKIDQAIAGVGNDPQLAADVAEVRERIGEATDVGGSTTTGTVMAKENEILARIGQVEEMMNAV